MSKHYYGGQAVLEGVMMRGRTSMAVAVRNPQGKIALHTEPLTAKIYTSHWGKRPFVRGLALLWDALGLGMRALFWSAEISTQDDKGQKIEFTGPVAWTAVASSLTFAIALFFLIPTLGSRFLAMLVSDNRWIDATLEGILRLVIFLGYLWLIGRIPEIARVFGYHGAEHKTINAYEAGAPMTVASVQKFSVQHVRCGTSFLLYVVVLSIFLFAPLTFAGIEPAGLAIALRFISRLLLVPVVAAISYELLRFSAGHTDHPLMRAVIAPGLALQKLTTREPDDNMVECAIVALEPVLATDDIHVAAIVGSDVVTEDAVAPLPAPVPAPVPVPAPTPASAD